jgi:hypothetical protein
VSLVIFETEQRAPAPGGSGDVPALKVEDYYRDGQRLYVTIPWLREHNVGTAVLSRDEVAALHQKLGWWLAQGR